MGIKIIFSFLTTRCSEVIYTFKSAHYTKTEKEFWTKMSKPLKKKTGFNILKKQHLKGKELRDKLKQFVYAKENKCNIQKWNKVKKIATNYLKNSQYQQYKKNMLKM